MRKVKMPDFNKLFDKPMANQGKTHIFLGNPYSDAIDKTTVEEGNIFSPGMWTFGVYNMIYDGEQVYDFLGCDKKKWYFDEEAYPIVRADCIKENIFSMSSSLFHLGSYGSFGVDFFEAEITVYKDGLYFALGFTEEGPAGGTIKNIKLIERGVKINAVKVIFEDLPDKIIINEEDKTAYAIFSMNNINGESASIKLRVVHSFADRAFGQMKRTNGYDTVDFQNAKETAVNEWNIFKTEIICPDKRIQRAYNNSLFHILNAMETGLPRISQWNYPVFWIRDCVIVLRALDYAGRPDLARIGCDYLNGLIFGGGFGSESDNPGEGIWALAGHYYFTKDNEWLENIFPDICRRVGWIKKMLSAKEPVFRSSDSRSVFGIAQPGVNVVCLENREGLVHGRMDWHSPDFYINCWCFCGMREAAKLAEILGSHDKAADWEQIAAEIRKKISENLLPHLDNERDGCITPYPCGIYNREDKEFTNWFRKFYGENRIDEDNTRKPENLWTYFEAAQIHNAFLLGYVEEAWKSLDGFLDDPRFGSMNIYFEGEYGRTEMLPYNNAPEKNGWLKEGAAGANMPHNWTSAETFNLIRDMFISEDSENGRLLLANCIPEIWRKPGNTVGVKNMPTMFGNVSYIITFKENGEYGIDFDGGEAKYTVML
jgi:hypothetical protein